MYSEYIGNYFNDEKIKPKLYQINRYWKTEFFSSEFIWKRPSQYVVVEMGEKHEFFSVYLESRGRKMGPFIM